MLPSTRLLVPSELDLDLKILPKIGSKIGPKSIKGYPPPKPPPMAIFKPSETSPSSFSRPPRGRFCASYNQTKNVSELLASSCGHQHADYRASSHCHRRGSSLGSSFAMVALWQNILEAQSPALSVRNLFGRRFLFG